MNKALYVLDVIQWTQVRPRSWVFQNIGIGAMRASRMTENYRMSGFAPSRSYVHFWKRSSLIPLRSLEYFTWAVEIV